MDEPKPRMPVLATVCCALLSIAAWVAVPTHHPYLTFYCGLGFMAIVLIVWFRNWRSQNIQRRIECDARRYERTLLDDLYFGVCGCGTGVRHRFCDGHSRTCE